MLGSSTHAHTRRLLPAAALICLSCLCARAQTFSAHLTHSNPGEGVVTLNQDQRLSNMVDYGVEGVQAATTDTGTDDTDPTTPGKRKKAVGYRIQVYWGNAQRDDREQAQRMAARVTALYPELAAYTSFRSPHWCCRVGDFSTRSEAADYLSKMRRLSSEAMIVKSEIYVYE